MAYSVPAVDTAIRLLNYLKESEHQRKSLAEACDDLAIPRSSGFNIMKTLEKHGFVKFDPESKRYGLGWALVDLGARASEQMNYLEVVRPYMRAFGSKTGLTCFLARRLGDRLMIVEKVESSNDVRVTATVGEQYPLSTGALGKVLMAFMTDEEISSYVSRKGLPTFTQNSITDPEGFGRELAKVRTVGYANSFEEYTLGVNAVAAPIFNGAGDVSLTVAGLGFVSTLRAERIVEFGREVRETARQITVALGGTWLGPDGTAQAHRRP